MGVPMELRLEQKESTYLIVVHPIRELETLVQGNVEMEDVILGEEPTAIPLEDQAVWIKLSGHYESDGILSLQIFGIPLSLDFDKGCLIGEKNKELAPISLFRDRFEMQILVDRCSTEVFLDGGRVFSCLSEPAYVPDRNLPTLSLRSTRPMTLNRLTVSSLASIHEAKT